MLKYTVEQLLADLGELQVGAHYKYVKLQGGNVPANECIFQGVDLYSKTISYSRVSTPSSIDEISATNFDVVSAALLSGEPCNLDVVLQGGGNNRSIFEALLANTRHVFACSKNRRKHIILVPTLDHPVGEISVLDDAHLAAVIGSSVFPTKDTSRQLITYGAPGTGKSWKIDELLKDNPKNVVRTTFHPDSDYATFVGAYKPTVEILPRMALVGTTMQKVTFGAGFSDEEMAKLGAEKKIVYKFVPQAFAKAYVRAWKKKVEAEKAGGGEAEKIYLVIEEINRGNCAQVFGDIFQLLDRPNGYSQYPILADDDLATWLGDKEQFGETGLQIAKPSDCPLADDDWADVAKGVKLALPPNLFIWATMNTSDQSLFPMDSAFKRRWDWKYVPIVEGRDKDTKEPLGWTIEVKADGEGKTRDWWDFIRRVNIIIEGVTQSEDKKLGYFFAKPKDGGTVIDENTFVSKVVFYLWSEVLKDCPADDENVAVLQLDFADGKRLPKFVDFFDVEKNGEIDSNRVRDFLDAVEKVPLPKTAADTSADGDGAPTPSAGEAN